jgi:hypothetical protein
MIPVHPLPFISSTIMVVSETAESKTKLEYGMHCLFLNCERLIVLTNITFPFCHYHY